MPESEPSLVVLFGDSIRIRLLDFLMVFQSNKFTFDELIDEIPMSHTIAKAELETLLTEDMILVSNPLSENTSYQINHSSKIIQTIQRAINLRGERIIDEQLIIKKNQR